MTTDRQQSTSTAYQLKITLLDIKPAIWRRIQVPDCTLLKLNKVVQACMGWEDCHMWFFEIGDKEYGDDVIDAGGAATSPRPQGRAESVRPGRCQEVPGTPTTWATTGNTSSKSRKCWKLIPRQNIPVASKAAEHVLQKIVAGLLATPDISTPSLIRSTSGTKR